MQPLVIALLIGTAIAMVYAAPTTNKLRSLTALMEGNGDDVRRARKGGRGRIAEEQDGDDKAAVQRRTFSTKLIYDPRPLLDLDNFAQRQDDGGDKAAVQRRTFSTKLIYDPRPFLDLGNLAQRQDDGARGDKAAVQRRTFSTKLIYDPRPHLDLGNLAQRQDDDGDDDDVANAQFLTSIIERLIE